MKTVRVLHIIPSLSPQDGGPSAALLVMAQGLVQQGIGVTIATTDPNSTVSKRENGIDYIYFHRSTRFYKISFQLTDWLRKHITDFDVVHIHALFSYSSVVAGFIARSQQIPYIIRPLGVLNQWGMKNRRRILKRLSLQLIELPILRCATKIHYTSRAEAQEASRAHPAIGALPSIVIPLAIDTDAVHQPIGSREFLDKYPEASGKPIVLFLSRVDPKKGIELLLNAFSEVHKKVPDAMLVIAGEGRADYARSLRVKTNDLGISKHVLWTGFLRGSEKEAALAAASVFVLPSFSENFGIAGLEALKAGVPTVLSDQVALSEEVGKADAGVVVPCEAAPLATAILQLLSSRGLRDRVSANARRLAKEHFSRTNVARALKDLYIDCCRAGVPRSRALVKNL